MCQIIISIKSSFIIHHFVFVLSCRVIYTPFHFYTTFSRVVCWVLWGMDGWSWCGYRRYDLFYADDEAAVELDRCDVKLWVAAGLCYLGS